MKKIFKFHKFAIFLILIIALATSRKYIALGFNNLAYNVGFNTNNIASENYTDWIKSQPDDFETAPQAIFLNRDVTFTDTIAQASRVLGTTSANKRIEVDLSEQRLYMKEGAATVNSFLVSTGKWYPTPTGEWRIWTKLRYTRMKGGSKVLGTYYDLPNVPYTMYYNQGYGIHGAYWHNNFGQPMSHGCVNMKPEEAGIVFNWASVGTRVVIHQ